MEKTGDEFPCQCRGLTKKGKRCSLSSRVITYVSTRESFLEAVKSGYPCIVRGMKSPIQKGIGLCVKHHNIWARNEGKGIDNVIFEGRFRNMNVGEAQSILKEAK